MGWRDNTAFAGAELGYGDRMQRRSCAVCRYRATDEHRLSIWRYDSLLVTSNSSFFGQPLNMFQCRTSSPSIAPRRVTARCWSCSVIACGSTQRGRQVPPLPPRHRPDDPVLVADPLLQPSHHPPVDGWYPHNVEWRTGDWSPNGSHYRLLKHGVMDYGWWYAARTSADVTNCGRRLIWGNIRTDVSQGGALAPAEPFPKFFFTSLPRELTIADDGETLLVRPPLELHSLRASPLASVTSETLRCAAGGAPWYRPLGEAVAAELDVRLNVSSTSGDVAEYNGALWRLRVRLGTGARGGGVRLAQLDARGHRSAQHVSECLDQASLPDGACSPVRTRRDAGSGAHRHHDAACFESDRGGCADPTAGAMPASRPWRVVQLHAYLDVSVIELFATDCTCDATATTPADCDCRSSRSESAIAVTAIAFSMRKNATAVGLYTRCSVDAAEGSPRSVEATVKLDATVGARHRGTGRGRFGHG